MDCNIQSSLKKDGYVLLRGILTHKQLVAACGAIEERLNEASREPLWRPGGTLHLDLVTEHPAFLPVLECPSILTVMKHLLGFEAHLSRMHYRAPLPGYGAQTLHTDCPEPIEPGHEQVGTAIVALVDFTKNNGATRVIPGSHQFPRCSVPTDRDAQHPNQQIIVCEAGDAILFGGNLRHGGTQNSSEFRRDSLQIAFSR